MGQLIVQKGASLRGRTRVPGDKSISHRTVLLGSLAQGDSRVRGFLDSADSRATLGCVRALGIEVEMEVGQETTTLTIHGRGLRGMQKPSAPLDCVRSGTTMRLLAGILGGQLFESILTGDPQLRRRPMRRIARPLRRMGVEIATTDGHAPLTLHGGELLGYGHALPVASAQVKSAILLAGLYADGVTTVQQPGPARDHTELMLKAMGADIGTVDLTVTLLPDPSPLTPLDLTVPGDISSAAFLLMAAILTPGSMVTVEKVGVNPTRTGLLDVIRAMGAEIIVEDEEKQGGEATADLTARTSDLQGAVVQGETVVRMIDEFPLLAVAATQAEGVTVVRDAAELRVKETDRIAVIASELRKMGAQIDPRPDGFVVAGPSRLQGAVVDSHGDHRIGMALAVAGLITQGETIVQNADCIGDSFPTFVETMQAIGASLG